MPLATCLRFGIILNCVVLCGFNVNEVLPPHLRQYKSKIQRDVKRALQNGEIGYLSKYYQSQDYTILGYPTYCYPASAGATSQALGLGTFQVDTTSSYAALFVKGKLTLVASRHRVRELGRLAYSFYPVNPPLSDKDKGLGSRDSLSYDIKLVNLTLPYQESAFIYLLPPDYSPTTMGFYKNNKLQFIDSKGHLYTNVDALIKARYGSKENYFRIRDITNHNNKVDAEWMKNTTSPYFNHK